MQQNRIAGDSRRSGWELIIMEASWSFPYLFSFSSQIANASPLQHPGLQMLAGDPLVRPVRQAAELPPAILLHALASYQYHLIDQ